MMLVVSTWDLWVSLFTSKVTIEVSDSTNRQLRSAASRMMREVDVKRAMESAATLTAATADVYSK